MDKEINKIYAVDFDGTLCVGDMWPKIGFPNKWMIEYLILLQSRGAKLILFTCRSAELLDDAVEWCKMHGLVFDAVNENIPEMIEKYGVDTRKIYADVYIDDRSVNPSFKFL